MGLDLALGAFVLLWAVRGWFKGFVLQAIGLASLIGCIYLADPVRDAFRPYARELFPAIAPAVQDRLLWWTSAVGTFVVLTGLGGWIVKLRRRRPYGEFEPNRADQGGGFVLGGLKGALVASFVAAAVAQYAPAHVKPGGVFEEQTQESQALAWTLKYRPAEQVWNSAPVQAIVGHVRKRGFWEDEAGGVQAGAVETAAGLAAEAIRPSPPPADEPAPRPPVADQPPISPANGAAEPESVRTARRPPSLRLPNFGGPDPDSPTFLREVDEELRKLGVAAPKSR